MNGDDDDDVLTLSNQNYQKHYIQFTVAIWFIQRLLDNKESFILNLMFSN